MYSSLAVKETAAIGYVQRITINSKGR